MRIGRDIAALVLVAIAAGVTLPTNGWNATAHYALVESLADGTPIIDTKLNQSGDIAWFDGHFYAAKSPGLAFLSVPVYLVAEHADVLPAKSARQAGPPGAQFVEREALWQVNLVVVAALFVLLLLVRRIAESVAPGFGTLTAVVLGVGTMLLPFSTSYFSHVVSATLAFGAFALLRAGGRRSGLFPGVAGLIAGLAVFIELPVVIVALALGVYAGAERPRLQRVCSYGAGLAVGLLPVGLYNAWALGSPAGSVYAHAVKQMGATGHDVIGANEEGFFGLTAPDPVAAIELLFGERGLITLTPVVGAAVVALPLLARRGYRRESVFIAVLGVMLLVYNASYYLPFGGSTPGPRFLIPLLPFLGIPLAVALRERPRTTLALAAISMFWMGLATLTRPLLPADESPLLWLRILHSKQLSPSVFGGEWFALLPFSLPLVAAVGLALAYSPLLSRRWPSR